MGKTSASGSISDFRFFVSEVKAKLSDGTTQPIKLASNNYQYYSEANGSVAMLDFEDNAGKCVDRGNDATTNTQVTGEISTASGVTVTGVEFTVGVPTVLNHTQFPNIPVLNKTSMAWNWASGRKFTKLEVNPTDENNATGDIFNYHLGSTGCSADANGTTNCTQPNRVHIVYNAFDPSTQKIVLDYATLLTSVDITHDLGSSKGCMSGLTDPECKHDTGKMLNKIGLDDAAQTGTCIADNCANSQEIFSIQSK